MENFVCVTHSSSRLRHIDIVFLNWFGNTSTAFVLFVTVRKVDFTRWLVYFGIFRIFQVTKKSNYSILEYSTRTHPIMRFAVESYPKVAFVVWCCTHKYTVESKKIQHCKRAPSSMFCCLSTLNGHLIWSQETDNKICFTLRT